MADRAMQGRVDGVHGITESVCATHEPHGSRECFAATLRASLLWGARNSRGIWYYDEADRGRVCDDAPSGPFDGCRGGVMTGNEMWNAPDIVPTLTYTDLTRAIEWLQRVFRFREREGARLSWPGGGMTWFEVGNGLFNIATPDVTWRLKPDAPGFMMKVYVADLDGHFAHAKSEGARIISEPEDGFWGGRIYRVLDHEGHQWEISQRGRDRAADRWILPPGVTRGGQT